MNSLHEHNGHNGFQGGSKFQMIVVLNPDHHLLISISTKVVNTGVTL